MILIQFRSETRPRNKINAEDLEEDLEFILKEGHNVSKLLSGHIEKTIHASIFSGTQGELGFSQL